jgi:hypothetical protein
MSRPQRQVNERSVLRNASPTNPGGRVSLDVSEVCVCQ